PGTKKSPRPFASWLSRCTNKSRTWRTRNRPKKSMASLAQPDPIGDLLKRAKTIAVVGLSDNPMRPSHGVSAYMQSHGYRIIPVNPTIKGALGEKAVSSLSEIKEKIDIVDVFRRSEAVPAVVDEAIQ